MFVAAIVDTLFSLCLMSLIYKTNNRGPNIDPCGIPYGCSWTPYVEIFRPSRMGLGWGGRLWRELGERQMMRWPQNLKPPPCHGRIAMVSLGGRESNIRTPTDLACVNAQPAAANRIMSLLCSVVVSLTPRPASTTASRDTSQRYVGSSEDIAVWLALYNLDTAMILHISNMRVAIFVNSN